MAPSARRLLRDRLASYRGGELSLSQLVSGLPSVQEDGPAYEAVEATRRAGHLPEEVLRAWIRQGFLDVFGARP